MKLNYNQILITDPCYIKMISDSSNSPRFDALKLVKVLHEGDDGEYMIKAGDEEEWLGVDSGRIWALQAQFDVEVEMDSGFSGHMVVEDMPLDKIVKA